jgi:hypothetical protein
MALTDKSATCEFPFLYGTGAVFEAINGFNYKRQFFFLRYMFIMVLVRRRVTLLLSLQNVHGAKASLVPPASKSDLDIYGFELPEAVPARNKHRKRTLSTLSQKKSFFSSLF